MRDINKTIVAVVFSLTVVFVKANSQTRKYPEINSSVENLGIKNVENYGSQELRFKDLVGQYIILDFWTVGCGSCLASFPKLNKLQEKYMGKLKIILVGLEESGRDIKKVYEIYQKKYDLHITSAYDSCLFNQFVYFGVPHLIWINKEGKIKAITSSSEFQESNINKFVHDLDFEFEDKSYAASQLMQKEVDLSKPLLINGNGGQDTSYLFRSVLSKWKSGSGKTFVPDIDYYKNPKKFWYQTTAAFLQQLYMVAYFGTPDVKNTIPNAWPWPVLTTKDSAFFVPSKNQYKAYNYCLEAPAVGNKHNRLMNLMQEDLKKYFGYNTKIEFRDMPYFKLIVLDHTKLNKLKSKNGNLTIDWGIERKENIIKNFPIDGLPNLLISKLPQIHKVAFDETGFRENVDLNIIADITNLNSIRHALRKIGLDLLVDFKRMKVLEISD